MKSHHSMATWPPRRPAGPGSLADCLDAAQAAAQRYHGKAPVARWQPAPRRWIGVAAAATLAAAIVVWAGVELAPEPAATVVAPTPAPAMSIHASPFGPASSAIAPQEPAEAVSAPMPAPDAPTATPSAGVPPMIVLAAGALDSEAWALHPEPVPSAAPPAFTGSGNVPPAPEEKDATPAAATSSEGAASDAADPADTVPGGGYVPPDAPEEHAGADGALPAGDAERGANG